jgi:hypothetical protein
LVNYLDKYTEMHGQQNVNIYKLSNLGFLPCWPIIKTILQEVIDGALKV